MTNIADFYTTLFDTHEETCWSKDPYGVSTAPVATYAQHADKNYFVINPLHDRRLDVNVSCYRNVLLEFDEVSLPEQLLILADVPYSTLVYSGGKSYHAIISLETPCQSRAEYDALVRRIYDRVPKVDKQTKNPSRFSRAPGVKRGTVEQRLIEVTSRILPTVLEHWLGPDTVIQTLELYPTGPQLGRILKGSTHYFMAFGAPHGEWNKSLFLSALDMARAGHAESHIVDCTKNINGHITASDKRTIASACKSASMEKNGS